MNEIQKSHETLGPFKGKFVIPCLAFPLILSNITIPLLGLSNTIIVGHLNHKCFLAAIGLGAMIFNFLYWGLAFFQMSTTGLMAQAHGAKKSKEINSILLHSLILALIIGFGIVVIQIPLYHFFCLFIHSDINVMGALKQYYAIRIWGAPAVLINLVLIGALVAIQKTRGPLIILTVINLTAILLSVLFVFGFRFNLVGVAWGDLIGQYVGLIVGIWVISRYFDLKDIFSNFILQTATVKQLLHANKDIFLRSVCLIIIFSFFTIWSGHISALMLAVNTLLMNFFLIMAIALGGFENVIETLSGQAIGENNKNRLKKSIFEVGMWALIFSLLFSTLYWLFGQIFIELITSMHIVQETASKYMFYVILLPLIAFPGFILDGVAIGINLFKEMRNSMLLTTILFFVVWYLLKPYGNVGLWLAFYSFFIFRALFLGFYIRRFYKKY